MSHLRRELNLLRRRFRQLGLDRFRGGVEVDSQAGLFRLDFEALLGGDESGVDRLQAYGRKDVLLQVTPERRAVQLPFRREVDRFWTREDLAQARERALIAADSQCIRKGCI